MTFVFLYHLLQMGAEITVGLIGTDSTVEH